MLKQVQITIFENSHNTSEADSDDEWDRPDTDTEFTVEYYDEQKQSTHLSDSSLVENTDGEIYAVVATYSTGDSFGTDTGKPYLVAAFSKRYLADILCTKINASGGIGDGYGHITYEYDDGSKTTLKSPPWNGYFESLEDVSVYPVSKREFH